MQQQPPTPNIRWFIAVVLAVLALLALIWFGSERTGGRRAVLPASEREVAQLDDARPCALSNGDCYR